jgi:phospholipid/cholesterol/gamma-HCH transport system substrate-binding protein
MEISARYVLIGLFALVALAGAFAFVYWLQTIGGPGERATYRVRFEHTVSGLRSGSAVLFNGVRVGDVIGLALDPERPNEVHATIAIQPATPIRSDTRVDVDVQGILGSPSLLLQGGSTTAPRLTAGQELAAGPAAGADTMQTARQTLRRIDDILGENAAPLHNAIINLETLSSALARNSNRIDGILAGIERLTGAGPPAPPRTMVSLTAPQTFPGLEKATQAQLVVQEATALLIFETSKILIWPTDPTAPSFADAQWSDNLPKLIQAKIIESFEHAGSLGAVSAPTDGFNADAQMFIDVRAFQISLRPSPEAHVELSAKVLGRDGKIIGTRTFQNTAPVQSVNSTAAAAALDQAFGKTAVDLVIWASEVMRSRRLGQ